MINLEELRVISQFHRIPGSEDFSKAIEFVKTLFDELGACSTKVFEYETGRRYENFEVPLSWDARDSELWLLEPEKKLLSSFKACRTSLLVGSHSTEGFEEYELKSEDDEDLRGKAVLAEGNVRDKFEKLIAEKGAKCLLVYYMREESEEIGRTPENLKDTVNYLSLPRNERSLGYKPKGFSLSYNQYKLLKNLLKKNGSVRIGCYIDAEVGKNPIKVLEAKLKGNGPKICFIAHICHPNPGSNDNASGVYAALKLAERFAKNPPKADLTFLLVPEFSGSVPYIFNERPSFDVVVNLDMVGEDQEKTFSSLLLVEPPPPLDPTFTEILWYYLEKNVPSVRGVPIKRFFPVTFRAGSDHVPFVHEMVPAIHIGHWPDRFYHTSDDTPDKVDEEEVEWIVKSVEDAVRSYISPSKEITDFAGERALCKTRLLLRKMEGKEGSLVIGSVLKEASKKWKVPVSLELSEFDLKPSKSECLKVDFEGMLGYEWLYEIEEKERKELKKPVETGEIITFLSRILKRKDSIITFVSSYYDLPEEEVLKILNVLLKGGHVKTE